MNHATSFCGTVRKNPGLTAEATHYVDTHGNLVSIRDPGVDGIVFRTLRNGGDLEVATVSSVTLKNRVRLNIEKDLKGSRGGPGGRSVENELARTILDLAMKRNPGQEAALTKYYGLLGRL
jgi:hypothetical protein